MRFLITGATGFLGRHLWTVLRESGHECTALVRDPERAAKLVPGARLIEWNGTIGLPPEAAFEGVDIVVNMMGESIARRWNDERKRRFRDSRVLPTRALVERMELLAKRPSAMISLAGTGYYGNRGDEVLTETAKPGTGFLAKLSQEWEAAAMTASALGVRTVVLRSGVVLDPKGGILARTLPMFRLGVGGRLGNGRQYFPWIHRADFLGILLHLATGGGASANGPVNVVAPEPITNAEFTVALGKTLGRPTGMAVPTLALKLAFGEMAEETILSSQRVSPIRVLEAGYEFKYPLLVPALADLLRPAAS